jgi:hypothetical protein
VTPLKCTVRPAENASDNLGQRDLFFFKRCATLHHSWRHAKGWFVTLRETVCRLSVYQKLVWCGISSAMLSFSTTQPTHCNIQTDFSLFSGNVILNHTQYGTRMDHVLIARREKRAIRVLADVTRSKSAAKSGDESSPKNQVRSTGQENVVAGFFGHLFFLQSASLRSTSG